MVLKISDKLQKVPIEDVLKVPEAKEVNKMKHLNGLKAGVRVDWLSKSSMQTHEVELAKPDLLRSFVAALVKKRMQHEMEVPLLEIWWLYLNWALEITEEHKLYLTWPCKFIAACGGGGPNIEEDVLRARGVDMVGMKKAFCPLAIGGHWTLLIVDLAEQKILVFFVRHLGEGQGR